MPYGCRKFASGSARLISLFMRRICCASAPRWLACHCLLKPDGTSFNLQNPIPHKSQKAKVLLETRRAKECQRGTAGAEESAKEGGRVPVEDSDTHLGARCREFESPHSDQKPPQNWCFEAVFITFWAIVCLAFCIKMSQMWSTHFWGFVLNFRCRHSFWSVSATIHYEKR